MQIKHSREGITTNEATLFISLSCKVSKAPTAGHEYWLHHGFLKYFQSLPNVQAVLVGPASEESEFVHGLLKFGWKQRAFSRFWLLAGLESDFERVVTLKNQTRHRMDSQPSGARIQTVYHFYEGGFREFALALKLAREDSDSILLFNFNLTDPWHLIFGNGKNYLGQFCARQVERFKQKGNVQLFAETYANAQLASNWLGTTVLPYPLFSVLEPDAMVAQRHKKVVSFFPNGKSEWGICVESAKVLKGKLPPDAAFLINPRWGFMPSEEEILDCNRLGIEVETGALDRRAYVKLFERSKVCVFPYFTDYYRKSSSGRLLDAAVAECVSVVPKGTSLADEVTRNKWGEIAVSNSVTDLVDATCRAWSTQITRSSKPTTAWAAKVLLDSCSDVIANETQYFKFSMWWVVLLNLAIGPKAFLSRLLDSLGFADLYLALKKSKPKIGK